MFVYKNHLTCNSNRILTESHPKMYKPFWTGLSNKQSWNHPSKSLFVNIGTSPVSAKFIGPSDWQDKYVMGPICLISSRTEMSDVASSTMYTIYTQSQTDISSVLWNDSPNRTECPMKFHKVSRTLRAIHPDSMTMLGQRWYRVVRLAYGWGWKYNVGPTLPQR